MNRLYTIRIADGTTTEVAGVDAPVPGLAIIKVMCDCCESLYAVTHIRSGTALMFAHNPEVFGDRVWSALREGNWEASALEVNTNPTTVDSSIKALMAARGDVFVGHGSESLDDVPEPEGTMPS